MSKILILVNSQASLLTFRFELIERLVQDGHQIIVSSPAGNSFKVLEQMGCECRAIEMDRHGMNPFKEIKLLRNYKKLIKDVAPDIVFSYTIKPNIYGGLAAASLKIPYVPNITGLGISIENGGFTQKVMLFLYKCGIRKAQTVFFQNISNKEFFEKKHVISGKCDLLPGSGVNLIKHCREDYPVSESPIIFSFVGRMMREKGIVELIDAAKIIKERHNNVLFRAIGNCEPGFEERLSQLEASKYIEFLGFRTDVHDLIKESHVVVLPSYHEGMANVLLEAAACARPVIATRVPGCQETFDEGVSGFGCNAKDVDSLVEAIEKFISLSMEERESMGLKGREKVEKYFDRNIVVSKYIEQLQLVNTETRQYQEVN